MKLKFLGAARTVTGSFFLVEAEKVSFAVDCGMFQGSESVEERNFLKFPVNPETIDFLFLTHAHIDHSGLIPKLYKAGFRGKIYCSTATKDFCAIMLPDSAHIQEFEARKENVVLNKDRKPLIEPVYSVEDAAECLGQFEVLNLDQIYSLENGVNVRFREAGHILGSCIAEIWVEENNKKTKFVFSGDLGQLNQPFVKDPAIIEEADYLVMESTYGDRLHPELADRAEMLKKIIDETMKQGGNLIIPSFAVERTQDVLYDLNLLHSQKRLDPGIKVYLDSPLAINATEIFKRNLDFYDQEVTQLIEKGKDPLKLPNLEYSRTKAESMKLNKIKSKAIIISASGMCDAGRILHHLKHNLSRPESTILFVGFQAEETRGRQILSGEEYVELFGNKVAVRASIEEIPTYSAHADQRALINWVQNYKSKPKKIFLVHGEEKAQQVLADLIQEELKIATVIPDWQDEIELNPFE
jgi:metallo-beta-lactamase family protein